MHWKLILVGVLSLLLCSISCKELSSHPPSSFRRVGYLLENVALYLDRCYSSGKTRCPFDSLGLPIHGRWGGISVVTSDEIRIDEYTVRVQMVGSDYCLFAAVGGEGDGPPALVNRWRNRAGRQGVYSSKSLAPPLECIGGQ